MLTGESVGGFEKKEELETKDIQLQIQNLEQGCPENVGKKLNYRLNYCTLISVDSTKKCYVDKQNCVFNFFY